MKVESGMGRKKQVMQKNNMSRSFWIRCLHAITSIVLGMFLIIWLLKGIGFESYYILSGSMEPTLMTGEIVLVNTNDREVYDGDIIAFCEGDHVVIHRIVKTVSEGVYITKGDANPSEDFSPIEKWQILGTVWMKLGALTQVWTIFTSKRGAVAAAGLIILHIVAEHSKTQEEGEIEYA